MKEETNAIDEEDEEEEKEIIHNLSPSNGSKYIHNVLEITQNHHHNLHNIEHSDLQLAQFNKNNNDDETINQKFLVQLDDDEEMNAALNYNHVININSGNCLGVAKWGDCLILRESQKVYVN